MTPEEKLNALESTIQRMVEESGLPLGFDARVWLNEWLENPIPALDNRRPLDVLDEPDGLGLVQSLLQCMQSGAFS